jgi:hypothetical protein
MNASMVDGAAQKRPSRTQGRRFTTALVAALVVHASVAWLTNRFSVRYGRSNDERTAMLDHDKTTIEIETLDQDDTVRAPEPSSGTEPPQSAMEPEHHSMNRARTTRAEPTPAAEARREAPPSNVNENPPEAANPSDAPPQGSEPQRPIDLGIGPGNSQRWMEMAGSLPGTPGATDSPRAGTIETYRPQPKSTTGGVQELLDAHDRAVGLGSSGPVITALEQASHSEIAPQLGTARFVVTVLQSGAVEVALAAVSDQAQKWREVGSRAAEALRRKPPRIPSSRRGVRMTIEIAAVEQLVNGANPKGKAATLVVAPPKIQSQAESEDDTNKRNPVASTANADNAAATPPRLNVELPGVYVEGRGKVCSYRAGITPLGPTLGGGCDLSTIGTKPVRVVSAKVLDENIL